VLVIEFLPQAGFSCNADYLVCICISIVSLSLMHISSSLMLSLIDLHFWSGLDVFYALLAIGTVAYFAFAIV